MTGGNCHRLFTLLRDQAPRSLLSLAVSGAVGLVVPVTLPWHPHAHKQSPVTWRRGRRERRHPCLLTVETLGGVATTQIITSSSRKESHWLFVYFSHLQICVRKIFAFFGCGMPSGGRLQHLKLKTFKP